MSTTIPAVSSGAAVAARGRYQGVLQILHFNWRMYAATAGGLMAAALAWPVLPVAGRAALIAGFAPAVFWMATSLLVSHYVYDRFPIYDLHWLERALGHAPRRWINIHAGWDETSGVLKALFPDAVGEAVDLFDPRVMTEASIREAHQNPQVRGANRAAVPTIAARFDALPFENGTVDAAFAIFAAHELRKRPQRVKFFGEVRRVLTASGELVVMEHARDAWNFLAFGPGFLHFFTRREWREAARAAGLEVRREFAMTPFVHVFVMRRAR
jgi:SAM-dependent methyltransferase